MEMKDGLWELPMTVKGNSFLPRKRQDVLWNVKSTTFISSLAMFVALAVVMSFWRTRPFLSISVTPREEFNSRTVDRRGSSWTKPTELPTEVQKLIEDIRRARKVAEDANPNATVFSEQDRAAWHKENPCTSRLELVPAYNERRNSEILQENPFLEQVLVEYSKFHRACMRNIIGDDIVGYFMRQDVSSGCKFVLGDNEVGTGIGNKVLSAAAQVVYAMLTQRVLLVPMSTSIPGIMCEPFEGSSWKITTDGKLTPAKEHNHYWHHVAEVIKGSDAMHLGWNNATTLYAARVNEDWDCQPQKRFFCDAEQEFYETYVHWMYFSECLYYLPKLFAVPRFRPTLEALFPDRMALTNLLRTVLLPSDPVWLRVQQMNHVHFKHVTHRVGIQARYFHGKSDYDLLHEATESAVAQCLLDNHLLPNTSLSNTLNGEEDKNATTIYDHENNVNVVLSQDDTSASTSVAASATYLLFITSLYDGLKDHLTKIYIRNPVRTGEAVGIVQVTHEDKQQFGLEVDRQALAEVLGLSLCDELVVTGQSTFGAIAAGYGGIVPWFIDIRPDSPTGCVRGHSVDACYQLPSSKHYTCPYAPDLDGKLIHDVVPYIHDCHVLENPAVKVHGAGLGFQLMTGRKMHRTSNASVIHQQ